MLNEIIEISSGFQSSVNIAFDLYNDKKIQSFIPTSSALELITNVISSTEADSTHRAKILTGAYGRGKSHIVLVLLSILNRKDKKDLFKSLLSRMKEYDEDSYKLVQNYIRSKTRLLPIVISGSGTSLSQSFLNALQQTLSGNDLNDIMPDTHFKAARQTIEKWQESYPETYTQFENKISVNVSSFIAELDDHNTEAYKEFISIYPELTAGSVFNPFLADDVAKLYEDVSIAVKSKGYSGIYIVYDEFGKYLETSIASATESDTKLLQDLAEKCNRSGNNQMHLMLICHKDISNYIDMNLPQDKVDGWRGISGRFEHINLHNNYNQMYEIIAAVIGKKADKWEEFSSSHDSVFDDLAHKYFSNKLIGADLDSVKNAIVSCYPLHPSTMFILPRLSEKVAQNERTLFTFLSANHKNTLVDFIEKNTDEFPFVTPDHLYDYFEQQFKKELNSSEIHKTYQLASRVLRKVEKGSLQSKIIKAIALIYIIEQFEKYPPTVDNIINTFAGTVSDPKEISDALEQLVNNACIVYLKRSNNYLKLKESSGIDVNELITNRIEKLKLTTDTKSLLNELASDNYLYPVRYNDDNCITRYFEFKFISSKECLSNNIRIYDPDANGTVQAVFFESAAEFDEFNAEKLNVQNQQAVIVVPDRFVDISSYVFEYKALLELKTENVDDDILTDELDVYLDDVDVIVSGFINAFTHPELQKVSYYYNNQKQRLVRKAQLSALLSDICDHIYYQTPVINNESINKNIVPTVAVNSRTKLTTAILESDTVKENLGLTGTGQDVSFMRSTLIQTGILKENDGRFIFDLQPEDQKMRNVLNVISAFFRGTAVDGEKSFDKLYYELTSAECGIGLKRGVIPIYLAVVLNSVKKDVVIRNKNAEVKITSDLLNSINQSSSESSAVMEDWSEDKQNYLRRLEDVFSDTIVEREKSYNSFAYITLAMNRWYMSLPRCAKEMTVYYDTDAKLPLEYVKFINSLKQPGSNSREYLIEQLPNIFKQKKAVLAIADSIAAAKDVFESGKKRITKKLIDITKKIFDGDENASLKSVLSDWYDNLKTTTIQHQFANNENVILSLISSVTNDEDMFISRLAKAVVGLRIDDWNKECVAEFEAELNQIKHSVDSYNSEKHDSDKSQGNFCKLTFVTEGGEEITRVFEHIQYSNIAKLLYNDISGAIEEIGQAISEQEKRQVLIEILEKMCR